MALVEDTELRLLINYNILWLPFLVLMFDILVIIGIIDYDKFSILGKSGKLELGNMKIIFPNGFK